MAYAIPTQLLPAKLHQIFQNATAITPTNNTQIGPYAAFYVGGAGDVVVCPRDSATVVKFVGVPAGTIIPLAIQGVDATNTTATGIVGLG